MQQINNKNYFYAINSNYKIFCDAKKVLYILTVAAHCAWELPQDAAACLGLGGRLINTFAPSLAP